MASPSETPSAAHKVILRIRFALTSTTSYGKLSVAAQVSSLAQPPRGVNGCVRAQERGPSDTCIGAGGSLWEMPAQERIEGLDVAHEALSCILLVVPDRGRDAHD